MPSYVQYIGKSVSCDTFFIKLMLRIIFENCSKAKIMIYFYVGMKYLGPIPPKFHLLFLLKLWLDFLIYKRRNKWHIKNIMAQHYV